MVRGAYVATPAAEITPDPIPYGWNPRWPYPGPRPPGCPQPKDLELVFVGPPPTPDEVNVDEEITVQVRLRDRAFELPTPEPDSDTPDISWYATITTLEGVELVIWETTSSWGSVGGYYGWELSFTPPLVDEDVGETLTFYAEWAPVFDGESYSVDANHSAEVVIKLGFYYECRSPNIYTENPDDAYAGKMATLIISVTSADGLSSFVGQWTWYMQAYLGIPTVGPRLVHSYTGDISLQPHISREGYGWKVWIHDGDLDFNQEIIISSEQKCQQSGFGAGPFGASTLDGYLLMEVKNTDGEVIANATGGNDSPREQGLLKISKITVLGKAAGSREITRGHESAAWGCYTDIAIDNNL